LHQNIEHISFLSYGIYMRNYIKPTIEIYSKLGSKYVKSIKDGTPEEIYQFVDVLPKNGKILDVGCAGGRDSKILISKGLRVVGIDLCDSFLKIAKKNVPQAIFLKKDLLNLNFKPGSFDGIWAQAVLLYVKKSEMPQVLKYFRSILKDRGLLFIGLKQGSGEKNITDKLSTKNERYFVFYQKQEIEQLVKKAGFQIIFSKICSDNVGRENLKWIFILASKN